MSIVYLTSGPRGAGKSTFCKRITAQYPSMKLFSKDDLFQFVHSQLKLDLTKDTDIQETYNKTQQLMYNLIGRELMGNTNSSVIVDAFYMHSRYRKNFVDGVRNWGADKVVCWHLQTPFEVSMDWFFKRQAAKAHPGNPNSGSTRGEYLLQCLEYEVESRNLETEGFDKIVRFDPRLITNLSEVL